ncbi:MAG TPA: ATP synthase F0 subunit B [Thermoanaerobaculia bacterium]|jgi:F-type H+-transporting ATPase subunit b
MIKAPDVTLLYVMFAFVASYAILKRFLFVPLGTILAEREREERDATRIHQESLKELERTIAEAERRLAAARREALKERETLRAEGLAKFERQLAEARQAAMSLVEAASAEIGAEVQKAASELPTRARELAVELAEKILGRKLAA